MALQVIFTYTMVISFSIYSLPRLFCGTVTVEDIYKSLHLITLFAILFTVCIVYFMRSIKYCVQLCILSLYWCSFLELLL